MLGEIGHCKGIENYTRHLSGAPPGSPPSTLCDYMPKDSVMFLDESHVMIGQLNAMYNGDKARKTTLVSTGSGCPVRSTTGRSSLRSTKPRCARPVAWRAGYGATHARPTAGNSLSSAESAWFSHGGVAASSTLINTNQA